MELFKCLYHCQTILGRFLLRNFEEGPFLSRTRKCEGSDNVIYFCRTLKVLRLAVQNHKICRTDEWNEVSETSFGN
jgi:hypothetical protein